MKNTLLLFFILNTILLSAQCIDKATTLPFDSNRSVSSIVVPNIFSPNGDDINEVFQIENAGLSTISCQIFSRWGVLIAELNAPNQVWDGYTTSGVLCSSGTYFYVLTAKGFDDVEYNLKGFIQLLR